nr:unnamed protein product [Callosobruchus chinensis]
MNGKRGSTEIGSCLYYYLQQLSETFKEITLYSDTCGGQNRNQNVAALCLFLVQTTRLTVIEHKFLESGHSYMEVDSMHSAIEHQQKFVQCKIGSIYSTWPDLREKKECSTIQRSRTEIFRFL